MAGPPDFLQSAFAPSCFVCESPTLLVRICPDSLGYERRTYTCPWCPHEMTEVRCVSEITTRLMARQ